MTRAASIAILLLLAGCEKEEVITGPTPTPYSFRPKATPVPTPKPTPVIKPAPTPPSIKQIGWIQVQASRWEAARVRPEKIHFAQAIAAQISRNRSRYEAVSQKTGVPWQIVGAIHNMEGSLNFRTNLGQGDPLTSQSRHIPRNRPPIPPNPPFTWEYAAEDAIRFDRLDRKVWSPIAQELQQIEAWNGTGYQQYHPSVPTPYLWSWSTISKPGKYVADGQWSSTATSQQCGVVPILKFLEDPALASP